MLCHMALRKRIPFRATKVEKETSQHMYAASGKCRPSFLDVLRENFYLCNGVKNVDRKDKKATSTTPESRQENRESRRMREKEKDKKKVATKFAHIFLMCCSCSRKNLFQDIFLSCSSQKLRSWCNTEN